MKKFLLLVLVLFLGACASSPKQAFWPSSIPDQTYYESYYWKDELNQQEQSLDEYLTWVVRFYEGWVVYRRGWHQMMDEVDEALQKPEEKNIAHQKMSSIGERVSAEWAKDRDAQLISTGNISVWGNALLEAIQKEQALPYINQVSQDVDSLLAGKLSKRDITPDRYFPEDPDDVFN